MLTINGPGASGRGYPPATVKVWLDDRIKLRIAEGVEGKTVWLSRPEVEAVARRLLDPDEYTKTSGVNMTVYAGGKVHSGRFLSFPNDRCNGMIFMSVRYGSGFCVIYLTPLQATQVAFYMRNALLKGAANATQD